MDNHKLRLKAEKENLKNATEQRGTVMVDDVQPSIVIPKNLGGTMPSRGTVGRDSGIGYMIDNMTRIERRLNIMPWGRGAEFESAVTAREVSGGFSIESQVCPSLAESVQLRPSLSKLSRVAKAVQAINLASTKYFQRDQ